MEMEVFKKWFYKGFGPIPSFVLDGVGPRMLGSRAGGDSQSSSENEKHPALG